MKLEFIENQNGVKTGVKITTNNKVEESKKRNNQTPAK